MNTTAHLPTPRHALAALGLPLVLLAASCSASSTSTGPTTTGARARTTSTPPGTTAQVATSLTRALPPAVPLDKTVWWSPDRNQHGLVKIHFTQAQLDPTATIPTITLSYIAQNIQHATRYFSFGSESVLTIAGKPSTQPDGKQLQLTADTTTAGTVAFQVDADATIDAAVLTLGDPDTNQSIVPLSAAAAVTTTEPRTGVVTGTMHGLDHDITVTSSILYADTTLGRKGKSVLALTVKASYTGPGGGLIGTDNFSLHLPNGTDTPGVQIVGEPLEPLNDALNHGETSPLQLLGFEIDQQTAGRYTLTYTSTAATDQDKPTTTTFTVDH